MQFGGLNPFTLIDYPGKTAAIAYTVGCNFRCPYCHNPELVDERPEEIISEASALSFLETRRGLLDALVITGGEPTLHGEKLLTFMAKVKRLGFLIKLDTNGTDPEFLKKVIGGCLVDYIAMDVKGPLEKYHCIAARPVDVVNVRRSIALVKRGFVPYEFRTTVVKALLTPEDLEVIAKQLEGAEKYYLQKFVPTKSLNPQFKKKACYTDEDFLAFQKTALRYVRHCGIR